jgi:hypothetical protein
MLFWRREVWCPVVWWGGQSWSCAQPLLICPVGPVWCAYRVPWCVSGWTDHSVRCRPSRTHIGCCIFLVFLYL